MSTQCTLLKDTDFWGGDIGKKENVTSAAACCATCNRHAACQRWTYSTATNRCFLKRASGWTKKAHVGKVSGAVVRTSPSGGGSLLPPPVPVAKRPPLPRATPRPQPSPSPTPVPSDGHFTKEHYAEVLGLSWLFYEAQRSGKLPADHRVPWRRSAHLTDAVPGGWYDAGDYIKLNFPLASTVSLLAWGLIDFREGYEKSGQLQHAMDNLHVAVDYLLRCHIAPRKYIGQLGHPDIDHDFWGRPEQERTARPAFVYDKSKPAADLMGKVSAALASASIVFRSANATYSAELLAHAKELWRWGTEKAGKYSDSYQSATKSIYASADSADDMAWGAAWIWRATWDEGYAAAAVRYWNEKDWDVTTDWDNSGAAVAVLLANAAEKGATVPGVAKIKDYVSKDFLKAWTGSNGYLEIVQTPKGMSYPKWSKWGNLQLSTTAAFLALTHAKHTTSASTRASLVSWARSQADYAMGSGGRSFIVGFGHNPPVHAHHAGASCPNYPARCDWANFDSAKPNPQVLYGALVGGPRGPGDDTYVDKRDDYVTNEVANDYNAGLTGALAGLCELL